MFPGRENFFRSFPYSLLGTPSLLRCCLVLTPFLSLFNHETLVVKPFGPTKRYWTSRVSPTRLRTSEPELWRVNKQSKQLFYFLLSPGDLSVWDGLSLLASLWVAVPHIVRVSTPHRVTFRRCRGRWSNVLYVDGCCLLISLRIYLMLDRYGNVWYVDKHTGIMEIYTWFNLSIGTM